MKQPFQVGQKVSAHLWDQTERGNHIGSPATVTDITRSPYHESGWAVNVLGSNGRMILDSNWLKPIPDTKPE